MRIPFGNLNEPGAYVNETTGHLYRIPDDALVNGRSPVLEILSTEPQMLCKISDDCWIQVSKARQLAADADLYVAF
jgi:hypothetical protein